MKLNLSVLKGVFAVCRLSENSAIPEWAFKGPFYSITRTSDELSIVCGQKQVPEVEGLKVDRDWKVLKVAGPLDFSLVGILADLSGVLAEGRVSVFVISSFDTDYILVKEDKLSRAVSLLEEAGHLVG